jgi:LPXTG-motif cell wall-anchored protein
VFTITIALTADPGNANCLLGDGEATITIVDDDLPLPLLSVADGSVVEGTGAGTTTIDLVVSTSALYPVECGFRAVLTHVSTSDADFAPAAFFDVTAVWDTDDQNIPRSFGIARDVVDELNETFTLTLSPDPAHPVPCAIGDGVATGTILDDDLPLPLLSVADGSVVEGTGAGTTTIDLVVSTSALYPVECGFRAVLTHVSTSDADFASTAFFDVTAVWDTDDQDIPRSFGIARDVVDELNETFTLTLSPDPAHPVPCAIGDGVATGTIVDDDGAPPDAIPPSVTVEQAPSPQTDPTSIAPIRFTVTFSEVVNGFAAADLSFAGSTTPGTLAGTITGTGPYTVAVSGMTGSGTVVLSLPAGAVSDAAGNPNTASTSTDNIVGYVMAAPLALNLPATITRTVSPGQMGAVVTYPAVTASGGVSPITVTCNRASGSTFPLGVTTVTCTATDAVGTTASGSFTVRVLVSGALPATGSGTTGLLLIAAVLVAAGLLLTRRSRTTG